MVRILYDDWSIRLGENRFDTVIEHLATMLMKVGDGKQVRIENSRLNEPIYGVLSTCCYDTCCGNLFANEPNLTSAKTQ